MTKTPSLWKNKPLVEQRDKFNQRLTMHMELQNGETAQPMVYLRGLLKTQSLEAWNGHPEEFRDWIAEQMTAYFKRVEIKIWGHSNG